MKIGTIAKRLTTFRVLYRPERDPITPPNLQKYYRALLDHNQVEIVLSEPDTNGDARMIASCEVWFLSKQDAKRVLKFQPAKDISTGRIAYIANCTVASGVETRLVLLYFRKLLKLKYPYCKLCFWYHHRREKFTRLFRVQRGQRIKLRNFKETLRDERGWEAIITAIVTAATAVAVEKVVQVVTKQPTSRWTIPVGPFQFQVGKGKPSFGFGAEIPGTPLRVGVMAGSGQKPSWSAGVKIGDIKVGNESGINIGVTGNYSWTGSEIGKGVISPGITVTKYDKSHKPPKDLPKGAEVKKVGNRWVVVDTKGEIIGKASYAQRKAWEIGLSGDYDFKDKKFGVELKAAKGDWLSGKVVLTKPKKGKPYLTLSTVLKKIDGKEVAVGVTLGKGKPSWEFGAAVDLGKDFRLELGRDFAQKIDRWNLGLTKYKIKDPVEGTREEWGTATYRYDKNKKKGYFQFKGGIPIPVTIDLAKGKDERFVVNTKSLADFITQKMMPDVYAKTWKEKIDYALQESLLRGMKAVTGGQLPPNVVKILAELGFGGERGIVFQKAVPDDYLRFARSMMPTTEVGLKEWQVQMLGEQRRLFELTHKDIKAPSLYDWIEFPTDDRLFRELAEGKISFKDFFLGRSFSTLDEAYAKVKDELKIPTEPEQRIGYIQKLRELDPYTLADELNKAIKESATKKELVGALSDEKAPQWNQLMKGVIEDFKSWGGALGAAGYGAWNFPKTIWNLTFGPIINPVFKGVPELQWELEKAARAGDTARAEELSRQSLKVIPDNIKQLWNTKLLDLFTEEQHLFPTAVKTVTWDLITHLYDKFANILGAGPYSQREYEEALFKGQYNKAEAMEAQNRKARFAALKKEFIERPLSLIADMSIILSPAFRASGALAKMGGFSRLATGAELAAKGTEAAFAATNPFGMLSAGLRFGLKKVADTSLGEQIIQNIPILKERADLNKISWDYKTARLLEGSRKQAESSGLVKNLKQFNVEEQWQIAKAAQLARAGDFAAELPAHLKTNPTALTAARSFRELSDINTLYALEGRLMPIEQLEARRFAPLIEEMTKRGRKNVTVETLRAEGYDPAYIPLLAAQTAVAPESTLARMFEAYHTRKLKPYVGDLADVPKLSLDVAVARHQMMLGNMKATQQLMQRLKEQGFVRSYDPSKGAGYPMKGYTIVDFDNILPYLEKQGEFTTDFLRNLEIMKNADAALGTTLQKWMSTEGITDLATALKKTSGKLYQIPKSAANVIRANFEPIIKLPIWDDFNAMVRDSVLAFRPAWIVRDFKNNAINYLMSGRNPQRILEAMKTKWDPLFPTELQNTGIAAEMLMKDVPEGLYGRLTNVADKLTKGALTKYKNAMYGLDKAQDNMFKRGFFYNDIERFARRKVMEDTAKSYFLVESELRRLTTKQLEKWARDPVKYAAEAQPAIDKALRSVNDWIYSYNNVWPLLTEAERGWLKKFLFFPEIAYWGAKKIALMPIKYPVQVKLLESFARINAEYEDPKERPAYLIGAEKIGENTFLRTLGGTIWDPEWGALNYQGLGMLSPTMRTAIETFTGTDLRTGKPLTSARLPWKFNPETNMFEPIGQLRDRDTVETELVQNRSDLEFLFKHIRDLSEAGLELEYDFEKSVDNLTYTRRRIKELEMELDAIEDKAQLSLPVVAERVLRNFPQYQWLEDALVPFRKYGDFTFVEPEIIVDAKTGEPKYPISRWLSGLRLLGIDISQKDIEAWQEVEAKKEKAQVTVLFRQMLKELAREKPEQLQLILDQMEKGDIPFDVPGFKESPVFRIPTTITSPLEIPEETRKEFLDSIATARQTELAGVEDELQRALDLAKSISPEFLTKMRDALNAIANERRSMIKNYYAAMEDKDVQYRMYQDVLGAKQIEDELKRLRDLPFDTYDIIKQAFKQLKDAGLKITKTIGSTSGAINAYLVDLIAGNKAVDIDELADVFSSQIGISVANFKDAWQTSLANLFLMPAELATKKAKDDWLKTKLEKLAFDEWKKNVLGVKKLPDTQLRLTPDLEQEIGKGIMDYFSLGIEKPFEFDLEALTGEDELKKAIDEINWRTSDALKSLEEIRGNLDPELADLVIKGIVDRSETAIKAVKKKYKTKARMKSLFNEERIAGAQNALERAVAARRDWLGDVSFQSWQDYFDPAMLKEDALTPLTTWLTALAGARAEAFEKLGSKAYEEYMITESAKGYTEFQNELMTILEELMLRLPDVKSSLVGKAEIRAGVPIPTEEEYQGVINAYSEFMSAYKSFIKSPSMSGFKDLYGISRKTITNYRIPVVKFDEEKNPIVALDAPQNWDESGFDLKFQELDKYSRTYASPEYRLFEPAVQKSYKSMYKAYEKGGARAQFIGVLLQK